VHESIFSDVLERLAEATGKLRVGPGSEDSDITPLISAEQRDKVDAICQRALQDGARFITGGGRVHELEGFFFAPTLVTAVEPGAEIAQHEIFGPVLVLLPFRELDQAIEVANGTPYGLTAGVYTRDLASAHRAAAALQAGQVFINEWFAGGVETPFGGYKQSGFGREKGVEALRGYLQTKNIAVRIG
jgi:acyl-CoA reductase-like NAD-dependent aldehyde dehydrogenase